MLGYGPKNAGRDTGGLGLSRGGVYGDDALMDAPVTRLGLAGEQPGDTGVLLAAARRRRLDRYWQGPSTQHAGKGAVLATRRLWGKGSDLPGGSMSEAGEGGAVNGHMAVLEAQGGRGHAALLGQPAIGHGIGVGRRLGIGEGRAGALAEGARVTPLAILDARAEAGTGEARDASAEHGSGHMLRLEDGSSQAGGSGSVTLEAAPEGTTRAAATTVLGSDGAPKDSKGLVSRVQLVREELMMGEQEYTKLQKRSIVVRMYTSWLRRGMSTWKRFVMRVRAVERALVSCMRIQRAWRAYWAGVEADALRLCRDEGFKMQERREGLRLRDEADGMQERLRPLAPWVAAERWFDSDSDSEDSFIGEDKDEDDDEN